MKAKTEQIKKTVFYARDITALNSEKTLIYTHANTFTHNLVNMGLVQYLQNVNAWIMACFISYAVSFS